MALCLLPAARAGEWQLTPRVSAELTYTDNVTLESGDAKRGSTVATLSPGLALRGEGARLETALAYSLQRLEYGRDEFEGQTFHQLQAAATAELVERVFYLEGSASAGQQNTAEFGGGGRRATSNISRGGDTQNVYTFELTPVLRQRFGSFADAELRVGYSEVRTDNVEEGGATTGDSSGTDVAARLAGGREFAVLPWSLSYTRSEVDYDDRGTTAGGGTRDRTEFSTIEGTLGWRVSRRIEPFVSLGYTDNEFETRDADRQSGGTWRTGLTWTPSSRSSVQVSYGEEPFGESLGLDVSIKRRRSVITVGYSEELTTQRGLQLREVFIPLVDDFGEPIRDRLTGQPVGVVGQVPVRDTDEALLNKAFRASYALRGKRSTFTASADWDERIFETSGETDRTAGVTLSLDRSLSRSTNGAILARLEESERFDADEPGTLWELSVRLNHTLAENLSGNVTVTHVNSDGFDGLGGGGGVSGSYEESRITAGLSMTF